MLDNTLEYTKHASKRSAQRSIPKAIIETIVSYGVSRNAGCCARKFFLSRESLREIKADLGKEYVRIIDKYRNVYVIMSGESVITAAFAKRTLLIQ